MSDISWQTAGVSDRGLQRSDNQDNFFISKDHHLLVVADGVGGSKGGALASKLAVEALEECWHENRPDLGDHEAIKNWLIESVAKANLKVVTAAEQDETNKDMGTTIVAAIYGSDKILHIAHAGDSRAYVIDKNQAKPVTIDHSVVMEMFLRGQLTHEQMKKNPYRHLITRCLGHDPDVEVDLNELPIEDEGWIVLASDGLSEAVSDEAIAEGVKSCQTADEACQKLLALTMEGGAPDNVTIVAARFETMSVAVTTGGK